MSNKGKETPNDLLIILYCEYISISVGKIANNYQVILIMYNLFTYFGPIQKRL